MKAHSIGITAILAFGMLAGGCASDGSGLMSTSSVGADKVAAAPKADPVCVALTGQIDALRKDGAVDGLEKASIGKSASVKVTRASLAKQAELNKANADFQAKCGPAMPKAQTAQAAPAAATAAAQVAPVAAAATTTTAAGAAVGMAKDAATQQVKASATNAAQTAVQAAAKN
jgi:hypothetical protein